MPNCEIRHEIGLGDHRIFFYIVATQDIEKGTEVSKSILSSVKLQMYGFNEELTKPCFF